jgi:hypothetical protein
MSQHKRNGIRIRHESDCPSRIGGSCTPGTAPLLAPLRGPRLRPDGWDAAQAGRRSLQALLCSQPGGGAAPLRDPPARQLQAERDPAPARPGVRRQTALGGPLAGEGREDRDGRPRPLSARGQARPDEREPRPRPGTAERRWRRERAASAEEAAELISALEKGDRARPSSDRYSQYVLTAAPASCA